MNKAELTAAVRTPDKFKEDWRRENPGLHLFHLKQACIHLKVIHEMEQKLSSLSNMNLLDLQVGMNAEFWKLINENAAYFEAFEILQSVGLFDDIDDCRCGPDDVEACRSCSTKAGR